VRIAPVFSQGTTPPWTTSVSNETSGIQLDASLLKQRRSETTEDPEAALLLPLLQMELRCLIHGEDERRDRLRATLLDNMVDRILLVEKKVRGGGAKSLEEGKTRAAFHYYSDA
jgi:hypothetical protein